MKDIWQLPIICDQTESDLQIYMDDTGSVHVKSNGKFFAPINDARTLAMSILEALDKFDSRIIPVYTVCPNCQQDLNVRHAKCICGYTQRIMPDGEWLDVQNILRWRLKFHTKASCLTKSYGEVFALRRV